MVIGAVAGPRTMSVAAMFIDSRGGSSRTRTPPAFVDNSPASCARACCLRCSTRNCRIGSRNSSIVRPCARSLLASKNCWTSASLTGVLSTVGTLIVVGAVSVAALIVGTQFAFLKLCSVGFSVATSVSRMARARGAAMWAAQRAAFQARRELAAKEKLEEAAFLAQLEADEEELAQAERDAAEADAIAEEAVRLSRQQGKKKEKAPAGAPASSP